MRWVVSSLFLVWLGGGFSVCGVELGGAFRPDRQPAFFLAGMSDAGSGEGVYQRVRRLRSGGFVAAGDKLENLRLLRAGAVDGVRLLVDLERPLSEIERREAALAGLEVGEWCADGLWFARVHGRMEDAVLDQFGVRWLGGFYPEDKVEARVAAEGWGSWALRRGGKLALRVRFFGDVAEGDVLTELGAAGAEVIRWDPFLGEIFANCPLCFGGC
ncbi:MAG: hypothetical protein ACO34E_03330 [Limisphaerales bacterium]